MEHIKAARQRLNQVSLLLKTSDISVLTACDELDRINKLIESVEFEEALDLLKRVTDLAEDLLKFDGRIESDLISSARIFLTRRGPCSLTKGPGRNLP